MLFILFFLVLLFDSLSIRAISWQRACAHWCARIAIAAASDERDHRFDMFTLCLFVFCVCVRNVVMLMLA